MRARIWTNENNTIENVNLMDYRDRCVSDNRAALPAHLEADVVGGPAN